VKSETVYTDHVFYFLKEIAPLLRSSNHTQLADSVERAMKHYIFPLTSEFYGVAMMVLRDTVDSATDVLTPQQLDCARYFADNIKAQWFSA
jgi:hypothetical protein